MQRFGEGPAGALGAMMTPKRTVAPHGGEKTCYLHIGPHKTGTTSIQNALSFNEKRLAGIGLIYPTPMDPKTQKRRHNHTPLARGPNFEKFDELATAPFWKNLDVRLAKTERSVILSTEHFAQTLRMPDRYDRIVDFIQRHGYRIVVVAYVRDQPAWLNSWYTQDQRNFASQQSFREFRDLALDRGLVDPGAYLRRPIEDPRVEVRVVSFEQAAKTGLARSFLDAIGVPADFKVAEPKPSNLNIGVKGMFAAQEIMRRVDVRIRSMPAYNRIYETFKGMIRDRGWSATAYVGLTPEDVALVRDRYAASNDDFARRWFGTDWATVCPDRPMVRSVFDYDQASEADRREVMDVVDAIVAMVAEDLAEAKPGRAVAARKAAAPKPKSGFDPVRQAARAAKRAERQAARRADRETGPDA